VPVGLGPRFLIEAGFIIAVAVFAGVERYSATTIILLVFAAWLLVALVEVTIALLRRRRTKADEFVLIGAEPEPAPPPDLEPGPAPESEPQPEPEPAPLAEPPPAPTPAPPRVALVPPPAAVREPEPPPERDVVSIVSRVAAPREWNIWELERIARDQGGDDVGRDEERAYLLMYLREFANADGNLPSDFDAVVRESFGDVLDAAYS
jgi:hypothetical protein